MPDLNIRNVPESTIVALRERAQRHGHSMQQEIREILQAAATDPPPAEPNPPIQLMTVKTPASSTWRREVIYDDERR